MNIYKKLQEARILLQNTKLTKSGKNSYAGYDYFELGDFLPQIQNICNQVGLCGCVSFNAEDAYLTIYDIDKPDTFVTFTSPMSSAALKGCHDVQNLGAVQTYLRRYLWTNAFEIVEHDAIDAKTGAVDPVKKAEPKPVAPKVEPKPITGQSGEWQIIAPGKPEGDVKEWLDLIADCTRILLDLTANEEDVKTIFKKNKVLFDAVKATDAAFFKELMSKFSERNTMFTKE